VIFDLSLVPVLAHLRDLRALCVMLFFFTGLPEAHSVE
jgi:hypothetical protein